jgi:hypothetical protein
VSQQGPASPLQAAEFIALQSWRKSCCSSEVVAQHSPERGLMTTVEIRDYVPSMSMRASVVKVEIKRMADVYVGRIETEVVQWGARLDDLVVQAEVASSDVPVARPSGIADLKSKYRATQTKLAAWKNVSGIKWGSCKLRVEQAWNDLETAFQALRNGFALRD